jgi:NAD(P)-dependent dehydrogenase (short-subunit alcohol dehydrogenase family)
MTKAFREDALEGRAGIVTGGGSGIGRATVLALVEAGADVLVADLDADSAAETVSLADGPGSAVAHQVDVSDVQSVEAMVQAVVEEHGKLDFAHNNAGLTIAGPLLAEVEDEEWDRLLAVDLSGVFYCMRAEIKAMLPQGRGSIVNTASGLGLVAVPRQSAYVAAKHGVIGLTRAGAVEYAAQGIRINALCPGVVETPLFGAAAEADPELRPAVEAAHPIGRLGEPSEMADAVVWLFTDASSFVTGQPIAVDGAYTAV